MPLVRVLAGMEDAGIAVDVAVLRSVRVRSQLLLASPGTINGLFARPEHFALADQGGIHQKGQMLRVLADDNVIKGKGDLGRHMVLFEQQA